MKEKQILVLFYSLRDGTACFAFADLRNLISSENYSATRLSLH